MKPPIADGAIIGLLKRMHRAMTISEIERELDLSTRHRAALKVMLQRLDRQGKITTVGGHRWAIAAGKSSSIRGRLEITSRGFGFVRPVVEGKELKRGDRQDILIPEDELNGALDGDTVMAEILRHESRGPVGRIEGVLEHRHKRIVGWFQASPRGGQVHPRNPRIGRVIMVPTPKEELGVKDFEWVWVEIDDYGDGDAPMRGHVVERLGAENDRGIDVLLLLRDRGIIEEFPPYVEEEAAALKVDWDAEAKRRKDLRKRTTLTIDPITAKDFDDALSIEKLPSGWRLYVHIADVAHFVAMDSAIDREAVERSTSVYPVDRVVPMLPERLSSDLCSLRPLEDRLTVTAEMEFNAEGELLKASFYDSIIHSDCRLSYEEVQHAFDGDFGEVREVVRGLREDLIALRDLARKMRKRRFARGALDLDIPQLQVIFDEKGSVSDLKFAPKYESHQLIEECMLAANEAVATELERRNAPLLYRVHDVADEDRLADLEPVLAVFGIRLKLSSGTFTPKQLQKALEEAQRKHAGHILRRLVLRSLKRAEYTPENAGHFGLASECYCHFTSPIRRYPDVIVHRQIKALSRGERLPYGTKKDLWELGEHTSDRERRAQDAESEATTIKALEFMERHVGEEFAGLVAGVQSHGIFVELTPWPVEGYINVRDLTGDHYTMDELGVRLVGKRSGHVITLGDTLTVQLVRVDALQQRCDLRLTEGAIRQKPESKKHWDTRKPPQKRGRRGR